MHTNNHGNYNNDNTNIENIDNKKLRCLIRAVQLANSLAKIKYQILMPLVLSFFQFYNNNNNNNIILISCLKFSQKNKFILFLDIS